jgi:hypothetical protein
VVFADGSSPEAIVVVWNEKGGGRKGNSLEAQVINTTPVDRTVDLQLAGIDPTSSEVSRSLGSRKIPANTSVTVDVPVAQLPTQSTGVSSPVVIVADFDAAEPVVGSGTTQKVWSHVQVAGPAVHVTFDSDYANATFRTGPEQARYNGANRKKLLQQAVTIRNYKAGSNAVEAVAASPAGSTGFTFEGGDDSPSPSASTTTTNE